MNDIAPAPPSKKPILPRFLRIGIRKSRYAIQLLRFKMRLMRSDFDVGDRPWLGDNAYPAYLRMLEQCSLYLEYGSGASTVLAARLHKPFISIESNKYFHRAVSRKIGEFAPRQHLLLVNLGWTRERGRFVFSARTASRMRRWKSYVELPWSYLPSGHLPDLVFVDGRFRVAAALQSFVHLAGSPRTRVLVDDYGVRPCYHDLEKYARLVEMVDDMAVFEPPLQCRADIHGAISQYLADYR